MLPAPFTVKVVGEAIWASYQPAGLPAGALVPAVAAAPVLVPAIQATCVVATRAAAVEQVLLTHVVNMRAAGAILAVAAGLGHGTATDMTTACADDHLQ